MKNKNSIYEEFVWTILPLSLGEWFEIERFSSEENKIEIYLLEKNIIPELPEKYREKKVINTTIKTLTVDYFPIKGKKVELIIKRRSWYFEGIEKSLKRDIKIREKGTHLEQEFASFLKEINRQIPSPY